MNLHIIILAAGQGTRMRSSLPKVLHPLAGRSLLEHVLTTAYTLQASKIHLVHGHGGDRVKATINSTNIEWVEQTEQLGTGHAVMQAMPNVPDDAVVLILYGDVPLIQTNTLKRLVSLAADNKLSVLTAVVDDATGYGRICRNADHQIIGIVEHKDAEEAQLQIKEFNTGFLACPAKLLRGWLDNLSNDNSQGEYYLTDIVALARHDSVPIESAMPAALEEVLGVNNRKQLAHLERAYQSWLASELMLSGVTLADPQRFDVRGELTV